MSKNRGTIKDRDCCRVTYLFICTTPSSKLNKYMTRHYNITDANKRLMSSFINDVSTYFLFYRWLLRLYGQI